MNWLITGGCGFIGLNLIRILLKDEKNQIRIIDNLSVSNKCDLKNISDFKEIQKDNILNFEKDIQFIEGDICDPLLAIRVAKHADIIVNLAANTGVQPSIENPRKDCEVNIIGTLNYLEAARVNKVKKFILSSSSAAVGQKIPPINEEMPAKPLSPYGASKLASEAYCSAYFNSFLVDTVVLRFGNVYGPGSIYKQSVIAKFIKKIIKNEVIEIYGDGEQTRDFIYIDDLVSAIILSATKDKIGGEIFQIANNIEVTINEIIAMLKIYANNHIENIVVKIEYCGERAGDIKKIYSDTSKVRNALNWEPKCSMNEGIENTFLYFLNNK